MLVVGLDYVCFSSSLAVLFCVSGMERSCPYFCRISLRRQIPCYLSDHFFLSGDNTSLF